MLRLAIFASGNGSNLRAIYDAIVSKNLRGVELALVISNNSASGALAFAHERGIEAIHISPYTTGSDNYDSAIVKLLSDRTIDLIALAGYMRKIPTLVIDAYPNRILNIHPALLPKFGGQGMYGENVHSAVIESGDKWTGATVHFVEGEYDKGTIISQQRCEVRENDSVVSLGQRVLECEHSLYPRAIQIVVDHINSAQ